MKHIAFLLAGCALSATAMAQTDGPIGVRSSSDYNSSNGGDSRNTGFGVKGGFTAAHFRGDDKKNYSNEGVYNTFHAGVYAQYGFSDKFSIQPELLYSRQGFAGNNGVPNAQGQTVNGAYNTRLDYIQVPVLLVYNFLDNVSVHVGPQVSLLTKVVENGKERKIANEGNTYPYAYNSLDYGLAAGLEARVGPARVGGRYVAGFNEIIKDQTSAVKNSITNIKNGMFQVYVGIGIAN
ncbi:porin family protein [Hymenobacter rubripertinctus]|uniref:PorT family protein n=1 Tax=Hymenobacter rubripertinctus TaxID=2029981 RepID=A0A418R6E3_9BACT|nr:porin family protein [Hymenobacter rubripertinctus]RIY12919.1 PorT family protein [Hymenobacter rubripertinctus]